ncbi:unnamed protein product [Pleuronectes platessa]|uniref:Uncharacterized protein n=1 Tax=Pleuronectes platessa TaxID=8262 RepID=A0A9N7YZH3_PLEPL|nr:unnamed protein product [Pleuronectes platessa]
MPKQAARLSVPVFLGALFAKSPNAVSHLTYFSLSTPVTGIGAAGEGLRVLTETAKTTAVLSRLNRWHRRPELRLQGRPVSEESCGPELFEPLTQAAASASGSKGRCGGLKAKVTCGALTLVWRENEKRGAGSREESEQEEEKGSSLMSHELWHLLQLVFIEFKAGPCFWPWGRVFSCAMEKKNCFPVGGAFWENRGSAYRSLPSKGCEGVLTSPLYKPFHPSKRATSARIQEHLARLTPDRRRPTTPLQSCGQGYAAGPWEMFNQGALSPPPCAAASAPWEL